MEKVKSMDFGAGELTVFGAGVGADNTASYCVAFEK